MACADGGCGRVDFDGGDGLGAGTFECERESTDAVEQRHKR
jgi:hypothetical protein